MGIILVTPSYNFSWSIQRQNKLINVGSLLVIDLVSFHVLFFLFTQHLTFKLNILILVLHLISLDIHKFPML